jgi:hypothetical protein
MVSLPDFREPLIVEINLARQINVAAYAMLPYTSGRGGERGSRQRLGAYSA